jgi:hypothetical protein
VKHHAPRLSLALLAAGVWGQVLVGGVTETTARICIWATEARLSLGKTQDTLLQASEPPICYTAAALQPGTQYAYEVTLPSGQKVLGSFHTPPVSPLRVVALSCDEMNPKAKEEKALKAFAARLAPHLVLHLGDWGYPDTTEKNFPPSTERLFPYRWENLYQLYEKRYQNPMAYALRTQTSWAYLYDDHDYVGDNTGRDYRAQYRTLRVPIGDYPFSPTLRENAMRAYQHYFPHYEIEMPDEALFQHFRWGEVEFFLIDNRSARTGTMKVFELGELGRYYFRPKPEISILGRRQMEVLKKALRTSTAKWKVILSGVTYNRNLQLFIHEALKLPEQTLKLAFGLYKVPAIFIAGFIADTWAGYPADQDSLLAWCWQNQIRGVVWVSGDTHVATLEDGTMGGFPELMTGGAGKTIKDSYRLARKLGISIFNVGGQGITKKDFSTALGYMEFRGDTLWVLSLNRRGDTLGELWLTADILPLPPPLWARLERPNIGLTFFLEKVVGRQVFFRWALPARLVGEVAFRLYDAQGNLVWESPVKPVSYWRQQRSLTLPATLAAGWYYLRAEQPGAYFGRRLQL